MYLYFVFVLFFCECSRFFFFYAISDVRLSMVSLSFFQINFLHSLLSQRLPKHFHAFLTSVYICLFSIPSNGHIVDIEYQQRICSATFIVHLFSGLFLHPFTFLLKCSRFEQIIDGVLLDFWC